jgi:hypothetical protein
MSIVGYAAFTRRFLPTGKTTLAWLYICFGDIYYFNVIFAKPL